jgi:glutaredoxin-related protein
MRRREFDQLKTAGMLGLPALIAGAATEVIE